MALKVGSVYTEIDAKTDGFDRGMKSVHSQLEKMTDNSKKILGGLAAAGAAAVVFGAKSFEAFNASVEATTKLRTNLLNVKGATMEQVTSLEELASSLQNVGVIEDDVIKAGMSQLATFNLQGKTIETLTPKITDMVAQLKGHNATAEDMVGINNLVGKVMTGNVGALSRYGVTLDEAQAKIIANGTESERAAKVVEVLSQNYGNINRELRNTPQGQITALKNNFGDLMEVVGSLVSTAITPLIGTLNQFVEDIMADDPIGWFKNQFEQFKPVIIASAIAITAMLIPAIIALTATVGSFMLSIAPLLAVGVLAAGLYLLYERFSAVREAVGFLWENIKLVGESIMNSLKPAWEQLKVALEPIMPLLGGIVAGLGVGLVGALVVVITFIGNLITGIINFVTGLVTAFSGIFQSIKGLFEMVAGLITGLITGDFAMFKQGWEDLKNGIINIGLGLRDSVFAIFDSMFGWIVDIFKNLYNILIGNSIIPDIVNGIINWFTQLPEKAAELFRKMVEGIKGALVGIGDVIQKPFEDAWSKVKDTASKIKSSLEKINPFHRESPSLVDNVRAGASIISDEYAGLQDKIDGVGFGLGGSGNLGVANVAQAPANSSVMPSPIIVKAEGAVLVGIDGAEKLADLIQIAINRRTRANLQSNI